MHQGSALSLLLFLIVMEALFSTIQSCLTVRVVHRWPGCELVIAETEDDLIERQGNVEDRGMRVNMNETKEVMISGEWHKVTQKVLRWPCGVCGTVIFSVT